jgi:hypothetical protein
VSCSDTILLALNGLLHWEQVGSGCELETMCQYPSGTLVRVRIEGGSRSFRVTDLGGAMWEVEVTGAKSKDDVTRSWARYLQPQGLTVINGEIVASEVEIGLLAAAVMTVANTSQQVAQEEIARARYVPDNNFKQGLRDFLDQTFLDRARHEVEMVGGSNKKHVFSHVIDKSNGGLLVIDPVLPEPTSMNSRIVAHMDLRSIQENRITQRLVYDDRRIWAAADLQMLSLGAPVLAFSSVQSRIPSLAAAA